MNHKRYLLFFVCYLFFGNVHSQNLIMNPGFEELFGNCTPFYSANFGLGGVCTIKYWYPASQSPDAFSTKLANSSGFHLPEFGLGYSKHIYPHSDSCCVGAGYAPVAGVNYRELIEGQLTKPLINGHHYAFSIWLHLMDTIFCFNTNIGKIVGINSFSALFSDTVFNYHNNIQIQNYTPQVQINQMLADTGNWVQLKDTFLCEGGGEQYIILGNFKPDGQFQWQLVDSICNQPIYSYYFMDDVSLIDLDSATGIEGISNNSGLKAYPNPAINQLTVICHQFSVKAIEVRNVLGQLVICPSLSTNSTDNCQLNTANLPSGIYFLKVTDEKGFVHTAKFVKE